MRIRTSLNIVVCICGMASTALAPPLYAVRNITVDQQGQYLRDAGDINNLGQVVGKTQAGSLAIWQDDLLYDLGAPSGWSIGGSRLRMNDSGQISGSFTAGGSYCPFRYDPGVGFTEIGGTFGYAYDVNNSGWVVGFRDWPDVGIRAFLNDGASIINLGVLEPGWWYSHGRGINDVGQAVGESAPSVSLSRGFLYSGGAMTDIGLPTPTSYYVTPGDINDDGIIVGIYRDELGGNRSFVLASGAFQDLGHLGNPSETHAEEINDSGQIVGWGWTSSGAAHAWLWEDGQMFDLNDFIPGYPGVTLTSAWSINDIGRTLCEGREHSGGGEFFILTPLSTCPGDLDGDGFRNVSDFTLFAAAFGSQVGDPHYNPAADLNGDGFVNVSDFTQLASVYGVPCP